MKKLLLSILFFMPHSLLAQIDAAAAAKIIVQDINEDKPKTPVYIIQGNEQKINGEKILQDIKAAGINNVNLIEEPPKLTYFLEVRNLKKLFVTKQALHYDPYVATLSPGQIIMIEDNAQGYIDKLRLERKGLGSFKPIKVYPENEPNAEKPLSKPFYIYDDYMTAYTVTPFEQPLTLMPVMSLDTNVINVYRKPGHWQPQDCLSDKELCTGWLDAYASIYLLETRFVYHEKSPNSSPADLYYYIGFEYKLPNGETKQGTGWAESKFFQRKIEFVHAKLANSRVPSMTDFEPSSADSNSFFIFGNNRTNPESLNRFTKGLNAKKARELASIWNINIAWDGSLDLSQVEINQSWLDKKITLMGLTPGIYGSVPIFLDLLLEGQVKVTLPITSNDSSKKPVFFKGEQLLQFSTPVMIGSSPLSFGVGGYYFSMLNTTSAYGVNSLLGVQFKLIYSNEIFWSNIKWAPLGTDLSFKSNNREISASLGFKMKNNSTLENWSIYGEYSDIFYNSPSQNKTLINQLSIGVLVNF